MRSGDIYFSKRPKNLFSRIIAWATQSQFSHTFVTGPEYLGEPTLIEAAGEVKITPLKQYKHSGKYIYESWEPTKATRENIDSALVVMANLLEQPYGYLKALKIGFRNILGRIGINVYVTSRADYVCSTLVLTYILALGPLYRNAFYGLRLDTATPEDIRKLMVKNTDLFERVERKCEHKHG